MITAAITPDELRAVRMLLYVVAFGLAGFVVGVCAEMVRVASCDRCGRPWALWRRRLRMSTRRVRTLQLCRRCKRDFDSRPAAGSGRGTFPTSPSSRRSA